MWPFSLTWRHALPDALGVSGLLLLLFSPDLGNEPFYKMTQFKKTRYSQALWCIGKRGLSPELGGCSALVDWGS